ncbi:sensor histidine kinase [Erysipelotrichaceae bacterium AF15-26LB]|nr:HAMP domain-containing histidine kinase [[Clostridium] innocuum]RJV91886.1 sensor histidine kinase [Erysipelotrichaceae bacterium AF15-26LB]RJV92070.1 sensor histidine kinase [Erysipelotrichaceae bacterium AF19-24AC]
MNKKKNGWFLKTYVLLTIAFITFFTVYAFRYDVLDLLYKKGYVEFETKESMEKKLKPVIEEKYIYPENINELTRLLNNLFPDNDYHIWSEIYGKKASIHAYETGYDYIEETEHYREMIEIKFDKGYLYVQLHPKATNYLNAYRLFCLFDALIISIIMIMICSYEQKHGKIKKALLHLWSHPKLQHLHKLATELFLVSTGTIILVSSMFAFLFIGREVPIAFMRELQIYEHAMDVHAAIIQEKLRNVDLNKRNKTEIEKILKNSLPNTTYSDLEFIPYNKDKVYGYEYLNQMYENNDSYNLNLTYASTADINYNYILENDQGFVQLRISYYPYLNYTFPYLIVSVILSFSYLLIFLQMFMRNKIKAIQTILKDTSILAGGDWSHSFQYHGSDEIGQLSDELRSMQKSFYDNMQNEKIARKANQELITTLSHDLRTPLTSLLGYLELIRYREGSVEMKREYLDRSLLKVEQIRSLSDKMFEYFLVFEKEETLNLEVQPLSDLLNYIRENIEFMQQDDMNITYTLEDEQYQIACNIEMLQRAMDNLFSNMHKYADHSVTAIVRGICEGNQYQLYMSNQIRIDDEKVESNRIGLKSVEKIMLMHNGTVNIDIKENTFTVELKLPLVIAE